MNVEIYSKFPRLKRFIELGGQHTEEGERYLVENPIIYREATDWDYFYQQRKSLGEIYIIHGYNEQR